MGPLGAPLAHYTLVKCFGCDVPTILAVLWAGLASGSGIRVEGIFRTEPDVAARKQARRPPPHPRPEAPTLRLRSVALTRRRRTFEAS